MSDPEQTRDTVRPMEELGHELKREREVREITLQEIAEDTKVSRRFLEAIEEGDHRLLPAPVFTRGFIHEYAMFLGLDADGMVDRYLSQVQIERLEEKQTEGPEKIPLLPGSTWLRLGLIALALIVIGGVLLYFFLPESKEEPAQSPPAVEAGAEAGDDSASEPTESTDENDPQEEESSPEE